MEEIKTRTAIVCEVSGADTGFFLTTAKKKLKNGRNNHLRP